MNELCGGVFWYVNLLVLFKYLEVDVVFIIMELEGMLLMFGFNFMCVLIVLFDGGILLMMEFVIELVLEVLGGLVWVCVDCWNGKVECIYVENVVSFVDKLDVSFEVFGIGMLWVDMVYGGDSFVVVDFG